MSSANIKFAFPPDEIPYVPIRGTDTVYPVSRIFCVGRNYADHAKEMGFEVDREAPWYFTKPANAIVHSGATIPYPTETSNFHYEMELVVAIAAPAFRVAPAAADRTIFGYACGLDMTRRDLQIAAREKSRPWDLGKAFEQSAIISAISPKADIGTLGPQRLTLHVGDTIRQNAALSDMVWNVHEIISHLSRYYHLHPGDLIYTGTPAGVGPVLSGDVIHGAIDGLTPLKLIIGPAE